VLQSIKVNHSLDPNPSHPTQLSLPPGEYNLYLDVNGYWNFIGGRGLSDPTDDSWAPGLGSVHRALHPCTLGRARVGRGPGDMTKR